MTERLPSFGESPYYNILVPWLQVALASDGTLKNAARVINVTDKAYGADPTGSADSTAAIQAAIDALGPAGGGTVFIPSGQYKLTTSLKVRTDQCGVTVAGAGIHPGLDFSGAGGTILSNTGGGPAIDVVWASPSGSHTGIVVKNLTIDSPNAHASYPSHGIRTHHFQNGCAIRDVRVRHAAIGIEFTASCFSYAVERCYLGDISNKGIYVASEGNAARYIGCVHVRNEVYAADLRGYGVVVLNCDYEYTGYNGTARVSGSDRVLSLTTDRGGFAVIGCYFEENGDGATAGRSNIFVTGGGSGGLIMGNYIDAVATGTTAIERNVWLNNTSKVALVANHCRNATAFDGISGGTGTGNTQWGNRDSGLGTPFSGFSQNWDGVKQIIGDASTVASSTPFFGVARATGADFAAEIDNTAAAGSSFGLLVHAGGNGSDYAVLIESRTGANLARFYGDGGQTLGAATGGSKGPGTINVAGGVYLNNSLLVGAKDTSISTGVGSVKMKSANPANNAAWIPVTTSDGTVYFVPGWTTNSP